MLNLGIFLVFDNIFKATYWECGRRRGVLSLLLLLPLPMRRCPSSSLVNRYHTIAVRTFLKLMIMIENIKTMQIPCLDIWSMLFSGQVLHRINSSHLFWNFKDSMLVQTLSYRMKITYQLLLIGFFLNWYECMMLRKICCIYM